MRFISQRTSISVPKVFCAFTCSGWTYIVMERIKGDIIGNSWVKRSEDSKTKLLSQLAEMICKMRGLRPSEDTRELIKQQSTFWPLRLTHGDLSSLNILVRGDYIVGIIDWETAGWYPSYWEYTSAHQVNPQNSFWVHEIDRFLQPMPEELAMERIRQQYFGDV
ncbi:kinase-like protein [Penicillium malachiteum]|uniref:Kinase-like protein n=1 Tax=Penicillium malachiteum TaxID=1324776 RepID=A0AAD6HJ42_9EURO|nr:kinase-like protein [Penicillium malachiteum]